MNIKLAFLTIFFPLSIFAQEADVTCWNHDCFKNGWTWETKSSSMDHGCYRDGCDKSGWILGSKNYTQCKGNGCFKEGWYQVHSTDHTIQREIVCKNQGPEMNCLKYGWTAYTPEQGQIFTITCLNQDCLNQGWSVRFMDTRTTQIVCKKGGCFVEGWREY